MRVIQVGIGGMGAVWLRAVQDAPHITHAAYVEIDPVIAEQQAHSFSLDRALIFPTLTEALAAVQADAVIDVTPPQFHKAVSLTALDAGLPVLSEKPLAATPEDAQAIVDKADATGLLHMVAQNYRYTVAAQTLKSVLRSGALGTVSGVTVEFYKGVHFDGFRAEMAYPLIIDMAIHHFDLLRYFLDADPVSVYGRSYNPPWSWNRGDSAAALTLSFDNGAVASYHGSWVATGHDTAWNGDWRFDCARGVVQMVDDVVTVQRWGGLHDGFYNRYDAPETVAPVALPQVGQAYLLNAFYEAVTTGVRPETTCQDNIRSLGIVFDAVRAFETGQPQAARARP